MKLIATLLLSLATLGAASAQDSTTVTIFDRVPISYDGFAPIDTAGAGVTYELLGTQIRKAVELTNPYDPARVSVFVTVEARAKNDTMAVENDGSLGFIGVRKLGMDSPLQLGQFYTGVGATLTFEFDVTRVEKMLSGEATFVGRIRTETPETPYYLSLDLVYYNDAAAEPAFWTENLFGISEKFGTDYTETEPSYDVTIPADVENPGVVYWAAGLWSDRARDIEHVLYVDGSEFMRWSPYREDCADFLENNPMLQDSTDTLVVTANYAGWCYGAPSYPNVLTNVGALTPGAHSIRSGIDSVGAGGLWYTSAYLFGDQAAGMTATTIRLTGPDPDVVQAHGKRIPIRVELTNDGGDVVSGTATIDVSSTGDLVLSTDGSTWSNPLTVSIDGASSAQIFAKSVFGGDYELSATDQAAALNAADPLSLRVFYNYALDYFSATASSECNSSTESAEHAFDADDQTKWCANGSAPHMLDITWSSEQTLNLFVVKHAGYGGESVQYNTPAFRIKDYDPILGSQTFIDFQDGLNTAEGNYTRHSKGDTATTTTRIQLYIEDGEFTGGDVARIYEFEMYNVEDPTGVAERMSSPDRFTLEQNYPNPFNGSTEIRFRTARHAEIDATIYDATGAQVKRLVSGEFQPGTYTLTWNADNDRGLQVAGGVYFYSVRVKEANGASFHVSRKMLYLP